MAGEPWPDPGTAGVPLTVTATDAPPADASALVWLLHPVAPDAFVRDYWQRRPLHLTGWPGRFGDLFDLASLRAAMARQHEVGLFIRVSRDRQGDGGGAGRHLPIDASEVAEHLRRGSSVCVDPVDRADARLADLAARIKRELGHAGGVSVKCYLSPSGYGFNTHFDAHVVTTLQLEGHKRWRISIAPGVAFPTGNAFLDADGEVRYVGRTPGSLRPWERPPVDEDAFAEVLLRPGDVLCLPAGTWHNAKAVSGHSLALNVAFTPSDVLSLLTEAVATQLEESPSWRAGVPAVLGPADGPMPAQVSRYLADRLGELVEAFRSGAIDRELGPRWAAAVAGAAIPARHDRPAPGASAMPVPADRSSADAEGGALQCVLTVADVQAAARWYQRVLGCQVRSAIPEFGWVELSTPVPGVTLGLSERPVPGVAGGAVLDFKVDDLERMRGVLARNGVTVAEPAHTIAGMARFLMAHDLEGNRLMFYEPDEDAGGEREVT